MKKYIGLVLAFLGIVIISYHIFSTAKTEDSSTFFLVPLGLIITSLGSFLHIQMNKD